jgi:hypothetical protein
LVDILFGLNFKDLVTARRGTVTSSLELDLIKTKAYECPPKELPSEGKSKASMIVSWAFESFLTPALPADTFVNPSIEATAKKYSIVSEPLIRSDSYGSATEWTFCPIGEDDLKNLHSVMQLAMSDNKMTYSQWEQVLSLYFCTLSPWRKVELVVRDRSSLNLKAFVDRLNAITDFLMHIALKRYLSITSIVNKFNYAFSLTYRLYRCLEEVFLFSFIICMESTVDILSLATQETDDGNDSADGLKVYFMSSIETIFKHLMTAYRDMSNVRNSRRYAFISFLIYYAVVISNNYSYF